MYACVIDSKETKNRRRRKNVVWIVDRHEVFFHIMHESFASLKLGNLMKSLSSVVIFVVILTIITFMLNINLLGFLLQRKKNIHIYTDIYISKWIPKIPYFSDEWSEIPTYDFLLRFSNWKAKWAHLLTNTGFSCVGVWNILTIK